MSPALRSSLAAYCVDALGTDAFLALWRTEAFALCEQLPPPYRRALDDMLMRIESSRLFSGDSCSFSRESLCEALTMWLDKAEAKLQA